MTDEPGPVDRVELIKDFAAEHRVELEPWQITALEQLFGHQWVIGEQRASFDRGRPPRRAELIRVVGRPAPQGSKRVGMSGQMREQSPYLAAWAGSWKGGKAKGKRAHGAVEVAAFRWYAANQIDPTELPYLVGPVGVDIVFHLDPTHGPIDAPPDVDKLARATFDALTAARLWEDDGRVIEATLRKRPAMMPFAFEPGAVIRAWEL